MINKTFLRNFLLAAMLMSGASESYALGMGFSFGIGRESWDDDPVNKGDRDISNNGFILDTAITRNRTFNYRFTLLKEKNEADSRGVDMKGYSLTHDFGLAVFRNQAVRVWMGPELKTMLYEDISSSSTGEDLSGDVVGFSVGPVVGVNVHLPKIVSFSFTAAYHIIGFYNGDYTARGSSVTTDVDADSTGMYWNLSVIFRINE